MSYSVRYPGEYIEDRVREAGEDVRDVRAVQDGFEGWEDGDGN